MMEERKKGNRKKIEAARIDIRLDPKLKEALEHYCDEKYETMSNVIKSAIKAYIGHKE